MGAILVGQSFVILGLAFLYKTSQDDKRRYSEAIVYYDSIIQRENIKLTPYDLIALQTIFEPEYDSTLEGDQE